MKKFIASWFFLASILAIGQNSDVYQLYEVEIPPVMNGYKLNDSLSMKENFKQSVFDFMRKNISIITGRKTSFEKAFVEIVIDENGNYTITNSKATNKKAHKEAIRTVKKMPEFTLAKINGKPVKMLFTIPVTFNIIVF